MKEPLKNNPPRCKSDLHTQKITPPGKIPSPTTPESSSVIFFQACRLWNRPKLFGFKPSHSGITHNFSN
jgi:hypothetical protein